MWALVTGRKLDLFSMQEAYFYLFLCLNEHSHSAQVDPFVQTKWFVWNIKASFFLGTQSVAHAAFHLTPEDLEQYLPREKADFCIAANCLIVENNASFDQVSPTKCHWNSRRQILQVMVIKLSHVKCYSYVLFASLEGTRGSSACTCLHKNIIISSRK